MDKIKTGWKLPPFTMPIALLGASVAGKPNFFTIAWFTMIQQDPALICASMGKEYHTLKGIKENRTFSINIPNASMASVEDCCGLHSGSRTDKSKLFHVFYGDLQTAPMIASCPVNVECRLLETKKSTLWRGQMDCLAIDPLLYFMPEGPYIRSGQFVAPAFEAGKDWKPES